ncbi:hypothetical protein LCGC14_1957140, partial [marine sediment metagenome]
LYTHSGFYHNKRLTSIDSVVLSNGFNNTVIYNLKPNENYKAFLDFEKEKDTVISDGSYSIQVYQNKDKEQILNFGYYSNGSPSSSLRFKLVIENDTISVNESWD